MVIESDPHAKGFYRAAGGNLVGYKESVNMPGRKLPLFSIDLHQPGSREM